MEVIFIGSGDAFGSGGRLQPCILLKDNKQCLAMDFGLSALTGLRQLSITPNSIDSIIISHLHGDHCGGIPFLLMDAMLGSKRKTPLNIAGPVGIKNQIEKLQEALFPGSNVMKPEFDIKYSELTPDNPVSLENIKISAIEAVHTAATKPLAVKIDTGSKTIAYTGDGEITDALIKFTSGTDLLIAECYFFDKPVKWHLNYPDIKRLKAPKIILTHMHENMLSHIDEVPELCAYDGMKITI